MVAPRRPRNPLRLACASYRRIAFGAPDAKGRPIMSKTAMAPQAAPTASASPLPPLKKRPGTLLSYEPLTAPSRAPMAGETSSALKRRSRRRGRPRSGGAPATPMISARTRMAVIVCGRSGAAATFPYRCVARQPDVAARGTVRFFRFLALANEKADESISRPRRSQPRSPPPASGAFVDRRRKSRVRRSLICFHGTR